MSPTVIRVVIMYIKTIKKESKREPTQSSQAFRSLEYIQSNPGYYMGGNWRGDDEVSRDCRQKWILQSVDSSRVGKRVIKNSRHLFTMGFYTVVDALRDASPDNYLETFMELPYVRMSMERCFGTADVPQAVVRKIRAAVARIIAEVMAIYNVSEEARFHKENRIKRLEIAAKIAEETEAYRQRFQQQQKQELERDDDLSSVRDAADFLAKKFFRQAMKEHHPDRVKTAAEKTVAGEKIIALQELQTETHSRIASMRELPDAEECDEYES